MRNAVAAAGMPPDLAKAVDAMVPQLVIVFLRRLLAQKGAAQQEIRVPVSEIDDTGGLVMALRLDGANFVFTLRKKQ